MIHQILSTTWKDLKILLKDTGGIATLFLMPLMFIIVMSTALQGLFDNGSDAQPQRLPVVNLDRGEYAAQVIDALETFDGIQVETTWDNQTLTRELAESIVIEGDRPLVVVFPVEFSERIAANGAGKDAVATVELIADPAVSVPLIDDEHDLFSVVWHGVRRRRAGGRNPGSPGAHNGGPGESICQFAS